MIAGQWRLTSVGRRCDFIYTHTSNHIYFDRNIIFVGRGGVTRKARYAHEDTAVSRLNLTHNATEDTHLKMRFYSPNNHKKTPQSRSPAVSY